LFVSSLLIGVESLAGTKGPLAKDATLRIVLVVDKEECV